MWVAALTCSCLLRRIGRLHKAGCPGPAHGLRKAGATRAAENGATVNQLMELCSDGKLKKWLCFTRAKLIANGSRQ
jgi:hypothetical protein